MRQFGVVGALLLAVGTGGFWVTRDPVHPVAAACPTASPTPAAVLPEPGQVRVVVLNGTPRVGLAKVVAEQLAARGFVVVRQDNYPSAQPGASVVTYAPGAADAATVLAREVAGARVSATGTAPAGTVQVVLGADFRRLATRAEVAAAAARPLITTASPSARPCR